MKSNTVVIVQARMTSSRLPGKVMADIAGRPAIDHVLSRSARAPGVDSVWLACTSTAADDPLATHVERLGFPVHRGDENDVLGRYAEAASKAGAGTVIRITGDCPMIDPTVIGQVLARFGQGDVDYAANVSNRTFPDGLDVEVFSRAALERANAEARASFLREHVTPYMRGLAGEGMPVGKFSTAEVVGDADFSHLRWTLDEPDDLAFFRRLIPLLPDDYGWMDAIAVLTRNPGLLRINSGHQLNEASQRQLAGQAERRFDVSNAMFVRAARAIPLATQTFSKSHQQWVKGASPLFIDRGRGCRIWDVDDNRYIDHVLGLLPVVLGYRDLDVDEAIALQMEKGICFPLASPLEADLAERLTRLIPCAEMVRFGKNGSDATTAAVRLARAFSGRERVIVCGYHGWHDWYIGTTTRDLGVPAAVKALTTTVPFNDLDALEDVLARDGDQIAALVMEPTSKDPARPGYLEGVRALTERHGVVLVFDEIITGFRVAMGGAQARHGVTPDLACFGKAMGNGMPISAIVGRRDIMSRMEDIFFSGTFGGEALSLAAAIATIDKLEREDAPNRMAARGAKLMSAVNQAFDAAGVGGIVRFCGEDWWPRLTITDSPIDPNLLNSLLRQEFVANGLLIGASLNLCLAHDDDRITGETATAVEVAALSVRSALDSPDPAARLKGSMVKPTFAVRK